MTIVYIGLGSNLSNNMGSNTQTPLEHVTTAMQSLAEIPSTRMISTSSLYKSKPVGPQDQDDYINAVAQIETKLDPFGILDAIQVIENEHGRVRTERWGPRTLDLDILMYGDEVINNDRLTIPHSEMENRSFVLVPLIEIAPDCSIPTKGLVNELLSKLDQEGLEKLQ